MSKRAREGTREEKEKEKEKERAKAEKNLEASSADTATTPRSEQLSHLRSAYAALTARPTALATFAQCELHPTYHPSFTQCCCRAFFTSLFAAEPSCADMFEETLGASAWRREAFVRRLFDTLLLAAQDRTYLASAALRERGKLYKFWQVTPSMFRAFNSSFVNALAATLGAENVGATQLQSWLGVLDSLANAFTAMIAGPSTSTAVTLSTPSTPTTLTPSASSSGLLAPTLTPTPTPTSDKRDPKRLSGVGSVEDARRAEAVRVCQSVLGVSDVLAKVTASFFALVSKNHPELSELFEDSIGHSAWRRLETLRRTLELIALAAAQPLTALASPAFKDRGTSPTLPYPYTPPSS